jgi:hypothetical protein
MRAAVNAFALFSAAAALQSAPWAAAAAEDAARSERSAQEGADQWVPSLSVIGGLTIQDWKGALASEICRGCSFPDPTSELLRESASGGDLDVTPFVGGNFELMTPELPFPASPRLFVGGEIAASFGFERGVAREGDPGTIRTPRPPGSENRPFDEDVALGQGSETIAELGSPFYGAYAGIAFPLELYGRQLRIKPAFVWIRYDVNVGGVVADAECLDIPPPRPPAVPANLCNTITDPLGNEVEGILRAIQLQGSATGTFNGIGPGLDIELDTGRFGPLGTSLFVGARTYYILGNRTIEFDDSQSFLDEGPGLGMDEARAQWSFEVDPWVYRVGLGLRFQWLGFAD